ncbi:hypothetical protein CPJCM30710_09210 [Clostridium polyendosporum]|uniref:Spore germination protein n=2 Tax=Clostridium polyendosporum TaxID=69208 RepID=A0A919RZA8_9CLOT|nr:Ger(x)C family spore germination protein [Clostridium polyendosporum]GIM28255.1 hypothetical protein CPJCM30710_09210 [Clostridium polyendosporum]
MIVAILILILSFVGSKGEVIERLEIPVGIGYDIEKNSAQTSYSIPLLMYSFEQEGKTVTYILTGKATNTAETREERHLKTGKKFILGLNRSFVFSEDMASYGIRGIIDILVTNPQINDRAVCIVCKGKTEDILNYKVKGYSSSAELLEGMGKNLKQFNFFSNQYALLDLVVRIDAEGRNALLPYVEITPKGIETTGLAIFKEDKMVAKTNIKEARILNILKERNVKGILTIQENAKEYINFYAVSKRKVKCEKKDGKYKFIIDLDIKGSIESNELYKNIHGDTKVLKKFEENMKISVEKMCSDFIDKIKGEYKVDVLDLGRVAAAKYGRRTGVDWNKVISDSEIQVNVKISVDTEGKGDY